MESFHLRRVLFGIPLLRSASKKIRAYVANPDFALSISIFRKLPIEFPMASKAGVLQKCSGKSINLIHTSFLVTNVLFGSKSIILGVINKPSLPQNKGPIS